MSTPDLATAAPAVEPDAPSHSRLEDFYRRHAAWLVAALRARFGSDQAEDLSQEAFVKLRPYLAQEVRRPRALLMTIATNAARERHRRAKTHSPETGAAAELREDELGWAGDQESQLLLKEIILGLPPKLREVFLLSRFEGLTYAEIAQRIGISVKSVEWRMSKALAVCAARLRE